MNPIAKIGFLIKGDYDPAVTYDFLDVVFYNGASYVAKKLTTGNTPVRKNEYWQIFAEGGTLTGTSDISDTTVAFQQAQERVNISTGESAKTLFGKIKKWFADLKGTAFSAPVSNLFATVTGNSLDATMGKILKDLHDANKNEINALNASLTRKVIPYTFNINATSITLTLIKRADILFINGRFQLKEAINMKSEIPILTISDTKLFPSYNSEIFKVHGYAEKNGDGHMLADGTLKVRLTVGEGLSGDIFYINVAIPCY